MIMLMLAAMQLQPAPNPCYAIGGDTAPPPGCPAWRFIATADAAAGTISIDPGSIERSGDQMALRTRIVLPATLPSGARTVTFWKRFDCRRLSAVELSSAVYNAEGVLMDDAPTTGADAAPVRFSARSPQGAMIVALCRSSAPRR